MSQKGVFISKKKDGSIYYRSSITYKNKHISLGSFDSEALAHNAYKDALNIIENDSITLQSVLDNIDNYTLDFEKIVILCNFRDNGIYSANPIYISGKILYYYFSQVEIFKFDIDDLFYYTEHRIQKRGNHIFTTELGSQINLSSKYGIKNHAVLGKDYIFVNGDNTDFRYSNIQILNEYQGVHLIDNNDSYLLNGKKSKKQLYKTLIHINGNFVVGVYDSKEKAAIAYNKAADILNENGCKINFSRNHINKMTTKKYNSLYENVEISEEIINYKF